MKTLDRLDVSRSGAVIEIRASARSFLHNQVRSLAGTLKRVGEGAWTAADVTAESSQEDLDLPSHVIGVNPAPSAIVVKPQKFLDPSAVGLDYARGWRQTLQAASY